MRSKETMYKSTPQPKSSKLQSVAPSSEERKRRGGKPPKQETLTGIPHPDELSDVVVGFKLENHRMDSLRRLAVLYRDVEGSQLSPSLLARRFVAHMIRDLEHKLDNNLIDPKDPNTRLP